LKFSLLFLLTFYFNYSELFKQLLDILKFYVGFEIDDHTGLALTDDQMTELHCKKLAALQVKIF
jgi:intron-binding protein aquarius